MHAEGAAPGPSKKARPTDSHGANGEPTCRRPTTRSRRSTSSARSASSTSSPTALQECSALPARQPDAGARLRPSPGRHLPAQVRADRRGDRGGGRLLRPRRQRADEELQAARHRPAGRLRDALRQVPGRRPVAGRRGVRRAHRRGDRDRAAADRRGDGRARAARRSTSVDVPLSRTLEPTLGRDPGASPRRSTPSTSPTSTSRSTRRSPSASSGRAFRVLGEWYADLPPY